MSILQKLTEGIVQRDLRQESHSLLNKWEKTGLLEGIINEQKKGTMARLLENQAKELLREASSMSAGDVEGFAAVAFPIVRRVFGGLIANELVSVQPMSLPSGLIFFLDFQATRAGGGGMAAAESLYGGGVVGQQLTGGIDLGGAGAESSFYSLNNGYSAATGSSVGVTLTRIATGVVGDASADTTFTAATLGGSTVTTSLNKLCRFDPDLSGSAVAVYTAPGAGATGAGMTTHGASTGVLTAEGVTAGATTAWSQFNRNNLTTVELRKIGGLTGIGDTPGAEYLTSEAGTDWHHIRRLNNLVGANASNANDSVNKLAHDDAGTSLLVVIAGTGSFAGLSDAASVFGNNCFHTSMSGAFSYAIDDSFGGTAAARSGDALGAVVGTTLWDLENEPTIPEIDIKVDSISVTAVTKKLKAKWTPELGQDLNAYHNLDAEVELTSILSEQIALEIDREIIGDLVSGGSAATYYWARSPGMFLRKDDGLEIGASSAAPDFTGTVSEWYETLIETINDVSAQIHRKTLRGGANFVVCSPEVANILEFTAGFRASVTADDDRGTIGAVKTGSLSKKFDVYVDPYFPRNVILVGRKGGSFLESGYVYAPYVPLQVTPTIFGVEDFVPRKGVMTRYAKKMVRPDMYGLVIVRGLLGEPGATS
jgi:hypothetical protein